MLIAESFRRCIGYVQTGDTLLGTAFMVYVPVTDDEMAGGIIYAITAAHVVQRGQAMGNLHVRVNTKGSGTEDLPADADSWVVHPESDVAAVRVKYHEGLDIDPVWYRRLASDDWVTDHQVGIGDEVFFGGLFSEHPGRHRVVPVVRFGNISLMREEPIRTEIGDLDAYLVECRSWGGHSGSPAFLWFSADRHPGQIAGLNAPGVVGPTALLGFVHGHYDIALPVTQLTGLFGVTATVGINAGMAVVVPAQKIIDVLMDEELSEERTRIRQAVESQPSAASDVVVPPPDPDVDRS